VLPGGQKEINEAIVQTALREIKEETGLSIKISHLIGVYTSPDGNIVKNLFEGEVESGEFKLSDETRDIRWYKTDELPFNILRFEVSRISDAQGYNGHTIEKPFCLSGRQELAYFSKKPFFMFKLLISYLISKITLK
jgi:ADP-ribose pyrophosphatase YjhB (NUDIX family)